MTTKAKRIYELAKEYKISSNAMIKIVRELKFDPKSHMSVATDEIQEAVKKTFAEQKQVAKKEMEHRAQVSEASRQKKQASPGGATAPAGAGDKRDGAKPSVAGLMRKLERKQRKKERRKRKDRRPVDKVEVAKSFRATMANLSGTKSKRRYRRDDEDAPEDMGPENLIQVNEYMSIAELSKMMDHKPAELIAKLFEMGMMATINQRLDMDSIEMLAGEFGFEVEQIAEVGEAAREEEQDEQLEPRAPIVTIMGHVDHGKTSLLDYVRKANVVAGEAGAITQHIGAYEVSQGSGSITFLDTPGHEAFTAMRARGSQITDIVVLIVAADGGVQPQTIEAIDHARAADVPIIVAISKIDKPNANVEAVKARLAELNLSPEDWGGKTIVVPISSKSGEGIAKLLEMILLQAEIMDLKADATIRAQGVVIDARLEKGRGPVATVLIQKGSCQIGDSIVAGVHSGRVRTITNDHGVEQPTIGPSSPAQLTGLNGVPQAGDTFMAVRNDQEAREISLRRDQLKREHDSRRPRGAVSLDRVFDRIREGQMKEVRLVIKADVDGSAEVLTDTLSKIGSDEAKVNVIRKGVGSISESDVLLAQTSEAIIIGFQVNIDTRARELARQEKVDIRLYDVIYEAEDDVKKALEGLLSPTISENFVGQAEIRDLFKVPKIGYIAGCYITQGKIGRRDKVRLVREGKVIYSGQLSSLRRFKDDIREVKEGFECGIGIENFNDIKVGDLIEAFEIVETARTL